MKKQQIKQAFEKSMNLKAKSVNLLGKGVSNVNYLIKAGGKKFVFRIDARAANQNSKKLKKEFNSLKAIEKLNIGPKPFFLGKNFLILGYIEGKPFTGKKITAKFLKELAQLVSKIHSLKPPSEIPREWNDLRNSSINEYLKYLKKHLKSKILFEILLNSKEKLKKKQKILEKLKRTEVITHGDICEQNVLQTSKGLALIDFEDVAIKDSAAEIAKIFVDFKEPFNKTQQKIFLNEYYKIRKDKDFKKKIKLYELFIIYEILLFCIWYILKLKNKEMHNAFLNKTEMRKGFDYAETMFKRAIKFKIISNKYSKFNLIKILK